MNYLRISGAALCLAFVTQSLSCKAGPRLPQKIHAASPTLSDEAAQAIKAAFPDATIGAAKLNMDRGLQVYYVELAGDENVSSVEVTATAPVMVVQADLKVEQKDLPDAVVKAANASCRISPPACSERHRQRRRNYRRTGNDQIPQRRQTGHPR